MFHLTHKIEGSPASWPTVTPHTHATPLDPQIAATVTALIWQCIEGWVRVRWMARDVIHIVKTDDKRGAWEPGIRPLDIKSVERWTGRWKPAPFERPMPYLVKLGKGGTYRVTSIAGDDTEPPAYVFEAWRLLYNYMFDNGNAQLDQMVMRYIERGIDDTAIRGEYITCAMKQSGALDLLRSK